jgi:hypothetical protein
MDFCYFYTMLDKNNLYFVLTFICFYAVFEITYRWNNKTGSDCERATCKLSLRTTSFRRPSPSNSYLNFVLILMVIHRAMKHDRLILNVTWEKYLFIFLVSIILQLIIISDYIQLSKNYIKNFIDKIETFVTMVY